ncbi:uncharacterized protein LOC110995643 [Pieris rapae]|uniref:uncharacterized protein LOC110995643 n=1 Tax=Pieris rapae TaxID=64459 RepID=UPI001E27FC3B|nr:uncharacterized protein LOC110995643 [Pieris rapae]
MAKFLIVTTSEVQYPELKKIFRKLLKYHIFNVTVLTQINKAQGSWTFYPLKDGNCLSNYDKLEYLGSCVNNDIFPVAKDLRNCTVLVTGNKIVDKKSYINYIQYLEEYLIRVSAKAIGVKIKYSYEDYDTNDGEVLNNYTSIGMLNYLQKRKADIVFGGFFLTERRAWVYDFISGYKYTSIKQIIPNWGQKRWKTLYRTFRTKIWYLIACAFISITLITMAISYYCLHIKNISRIPLHLFDYFFGHSDRNLFKVKKLRIILISWVFFTFFIASFYNSEIVSLLTKPRYEPQSYSNEELKQNGYKTCISDSFRTYNKIVYNITEPDAQVPECKNTEDVLNTITTRENYYTVADYSQFQKNLCHYNARFDETDMLNNIMYALYTNKGFFLKEKFKRIVSAIFESGIIQDSHIYSLISKGCAKQTHHSEQTYKVLSLHDLQLTFYILLTGYLISLVVFLIECSF